MLNWVQKVIFKIRYRWIKSNLRIRLHQTKLAHYGKHYYYRLCRILGDKWYYLKEYIRTFDDPSTGIIYIKRTVVFYVYMFLCTYVIIVVYYALFKNLSLSESFAIITWEVIPKVMHDIYLILKEIFRKD